MVVDAFAGLRATYENFNENERKGVLAIGFILAAMIILLPMFLLTQSISDISDENEEIQKVLRDLASARPTLQKREAERNAAKKRYRKKAPALGGFIEAQAQAQTLTVREVTDQPEKVIGNFTRRNVRATVAAVGLRNSVKMLTSIANSSYPVALERIQFEHFRSGDEYNVQLGVIAYDQNEPDKSAEPKGPGKGRAGPARPE